MIIKNTFILAVVTVGSLAVTPAQAFFCANFFSKASRPPPPRIAPAYAYYPQRPMPSPYAPQGYYSRVPVQGYLPSIGAPPVRQKSFCPF